jgi:lysophospholipase L1-like esterase
MKKIIIFLLVVTPFIGFSQHNLTGGGTVAYNSSGKFGSSINGGYGYNASFSLPNVSTFEAWIKTTSSSGIFFGDLGTFWMAAGQLRYGNSEYTLFFTAPTLTDGNWHHVAVVFGVSDTKIFIDGALNTSDAVTLTSRGNTGTKFVVRDFLGDGSYTFPGEMDEVAVWSGEKYTGAFTPPTSAYAGTESGLLALYHLDNTLLDEAGGTATPPNIIHPDSSAISYSPYNWNITHTSATSINAGAYFRTKFTGASCTLNFDVSTMGTPASQLYYRIDGVGAWTKVSVEATIVCTMPTATGGYQQHFLEVVIKSTSETLQRWSTLATAVKFTGITLDPNAYLVAVGKKLLNILFFGDSITEGVRTVNASDTYDTDRNDATQTWDYELGKYLGAEVGIVGFGAQGWNVTGSGSVPPLPSSYNLLYSGASRSFSTQPDLVVINMGTNDGAANVVAQETTFLNTMLSTVSCKIAVLRPFHGDQSANLQTAIAACSNPSRVTYIDTNGMFNTAYSYDGYHPYGFTNIADIAPALASPLKALLLGATSTPQVLNFAF